ncbi:MAG: hypothetical protein SFY68_08670 [Candidatus Sumerlaeia bacterium]|nr:hypothetical protein [Candidatus Sumerlaeia bacterium]
MAEMDKDLERIQKKLQEVEALQKRNKTTSMLATLAIVIVAIVMVLIVINPIFSLVQEREKIGETLVTKAHERLAPKLGTEVQSLVEEVVPKYQEKAGAIISKRETEIVDKLTKEYDLLYANLNDEITKTVDAFLKDFSQRQFDLLLEEYPELTDLDSTPDPNNPDMRKSDMIVHAVQGASARLSADIFAKHTEALNKLDVQFNSLEVPASLKELNNEELKSLVLNEAFDFFYDMMNSDTEGEVVQ